MKEFDAKSVIELIQDRDQDLDLYQGPDHVPNPIQEPKMETRLENQLVKKYRLPFIKVIQQKR